MTKQQDETNNTLKKRTTNKKDDDSSKTTTTTTSTTTTATPMNKTSTDKIKLNYPIFCCASSKDTKNPYIVTGGGGGKSKTGVPNAITLLKWCLGGETTTTGNNSSEFINVDQMNTDDCIPFISFNESKNQLAYAIGSMCYIVSYENNKLEKVSSFNTNNDIPSNAYQLAINANSTLSPSLSPAIKTVNHSTSSTPSESPSTTPSATTMTTDDSEIKLIRFNKKGDRIIIVDSNYMVKVWSVPSYKFIKLISTGHTGEITDIDVHPTSTHIVTTSRDCSGKVINLLNGKTEFTMSHKNKPKLGFRGCKFTHDGLYIYTAQSIPRNKNSTGCTVLSKWNFINGKEECYKEVDTMHNTTFDLSPDSNIIAISTADSKITAYSTIENSFKQLDKWEPHEFVITGACFSPDSSTVFSCSADYNCRSHRIGSYHSNQKFFKIIFVLAIFILIISLIIGKLNNLN